VLEMLRDLITHKGYANAAMMAAIRQNDAAVSDPEIRELLQHILIANRFWLLSILGLPFDPADESGASSIDPLIRAYQSTQEAEAAWLAAATEADLEQRLVSPLIPGGRCSVAQALMQVCMHSHGHRAQCAKLLRRYGGEAPRTDFILWLTRRTAADWRGSAGADSAR